MKIDTKRPLLDLKGEPLGDLNLGDAVGNMLAASKVGGKMKMYILATRFATESDFELDHADMELVKSAAEGCEIYRPLVTGQILKILSE